MVYIRKYIILCTNDIEYVTHDAASKSQPKKPVLPYSVIRKNAHMKNISEDHKLPTYLPITGNFKTTLVFGGC